MPSVPLIVVLEEQLERSSAGQLGFGMSILAFRIWTRSPPSLPAPLSSSGTPPAWNWTSQQLLAPPRGADESRHAVGMTFGQPQKPSVRNEVGIPAIRSPSGVHPMSMLERCLVSLSCCVRNRQSCAWQTECQDGGDGDRGTVRSPAATSFSSETRGIFGRSDDT